MDIFKIQINLRIFFYKFTQKKLNSIILKKLRGQPLNNQKFKNLLNNHDKKLSKKDANEYLQEDLLKFLYFMQV